MKNRDASKTKKSGATGALLAGLIVGIIIFAVMLYMEKAVLNEEEKISVYVAQSDVAAGIKIDEGNIGSYFEIKQVPKSLVPGQAISDVASFTGLYTEMDITKGQILTTSMFLEQNELLKSFNNPVVAGFSTSQLFRSVNGTLRTGDYVNIYYVDEIDVGNGSNNKVTVSVLLWENVFLDGPYTTDGKAVATDGTDANVAQAFNIYLEADQVVDFYGGLNDGNLALVKVVNAEPGTQRMVTSIADAKAAVIEQVRTGSSSTGTTSISSDPFDMFVPDMYSDVFDDKTDAEGDN